MTSFDRFAPMIAAAFPETGDAGEIIASPLRTIPCYEHWLKANFLHEILGKKLVKCDNLLPISGTIKDRGGIYAVLKYVEELAHK